MLPLLVAAATLIDLSYPYDAKTLYWPTGGGDFQLKQLHYGKTDAGYFYSAYSFCTPEHGGTHMDAPIHFAEHGLTIDKIPAARLVGPAVVVDVREKARGDRDYRVTAQDLAGDRLPFDGLADDERTLAVAALGAVVAQPRDGHTADRGFPRAPS